VTGKRGRGPIRRLGAAAALAALAAAVVVAAPVAATLADTPPPAVITIDRPGGGEVLRAGEVEIAGRVARTAAAGTATVVYVADVSASTADPAAGGCGGPDGGPAGDRNGDGEAGDALDCEIAVLARVNDRLRAVAGDPGRVQVGLVAFGSRAAVADLSPAPGEQPLVHPGAASGAASGAGGGTPDVVAAATSLRRGRILRHTPHRVGDHTHLGDAVDAGLGVLRGAPPGPRWLVVLSDGNGKVPRRHLARLGDATRDGGVRLRAFALAGVDVDVDGPGCGPGEAAIRNEVMSL